MRCLRRASGNPTAANRIPVDAMAAMRPDRAALDATARVRRRRWCPGWSSQRARGHRSRPEDVLRPVGSFTGAGDPAAASCDSAQSRHLTHIQGAVTDVEPAPGRCRLAAARASRETSCGIRSGARMSPGAWGHAGTRDAPDHGSRGRPCRKAGRATAAIRITQGCGWELHVVFLSELSIKPGCID